MSYFFYKMNLEPYKKSGYAFDKVWIGFFPYKKRILRLLNN